MREVCSAADARGSIPISAGANNFTIIVTHWKDQDRWPAERLAVIGSEQQPGNSALQTMAPTNREVDVSDRVSKLVEIKDGVTLGQGKPPHWRLEPPGSHAMTELTGPPEGYRSLLVKRAAIPWRVGCVGAGAAHDRGSLRRASRTFTRKGRKMGKTLESRHGLPPGAWEGAVGALGWTPPRPTPPRSLAAPGQTGVG